MKLKYPSMDQFVENNFEIEGDGGVDQSLEMISSCIEMIYNDDECLSLIHI